MAFEGDLTNLGLADIFQTLGMNRQSGTLVVNHKGVERRFYFSDDGVSLLTSRNARRFRLGNLLVGMGRLSEDDLRVAVLKQERAKDTKIGDLLIQTELVTDDDIKEACRYQAAEEIYDSFNWKSGKFQFLEGANAGPESGPGPFAEFFFEVTDVVMEAARRADEFEQNMSRIGEQSEFFGRVDAAPLDEAVHGRAAVLLHKSLDGTMNVETVFSEFYLSPFDTSEAFIRLLDHNLVKPMDVEDLRGTAQAYLEKRDWERAMPVLRRALFHLPRDEGLLKSLIHTQLETGLRKEASKTTTELAQVLHDGGQSVESIEALRQAVEQDPRNEQAYELLMEFHAALDQLGKSEDACAEAARLRSDDRDFQGALILLERGLKMVPESLNLRIQRANCLMALGQRDEGITELNDVVQILEERKESGPLLASVYRKLLQLDPDRKDLQNRIDSIVAGEKNRERRKQLVKVGMGLGVAAVLTLGWMLRPKSDDERLRDAEALVATNDPSRLDEANTIASEVLEGAASGSDAAIGAKRVLDSIVAIKEGPLRKERVDKFRTELESEYLTPSREMLTAQSYADAVRRSMAALEATKGDSAELEAMAGQDLNVLKGFVQAEVSKILARIGTALSMRRNEIHQTLATVEPVELQKVDLERQRRVYESAGAILDARSAVDWSAVVDQLEEADATLGGIEGVRIRDLRRYVEEMDSALSALENKWNEARALVVQANVQEEFRSTMKSIQAAKLSGEIEKGIAACDTFLKACDKVLLEQPYKYFAPVHERLFEGLDLDGLITESRTKLEAARDGLAEAERAQEAGDLQRAFDVLCKTISDAQDINFRRRAMLPLRVSSRPGGATLVVTLPDGEPFEAGLTHDPLEEESEEKVIKYPYQGTTVLRIQKAGFETAVIERTGIEGDRDAAIVVDLQRHARWRRETGASIEGMPGLTDSLVLVGTRSGLFRGLDVTTGDEQFQLKTDHLSGISSGVLVEGDVAWFGGNDGEAFAVDLKARKFLWRHKTTRKVSRMPVKSGDTVIFADEAGTLFAFGASDGSEKWKKDFGHSCTGGLAATGGLVMVGLADYRVEALAVADGAPKWTARLTGPVYGPATLDGSGGVLVGTESATVVRIDATTGDISWTAKTGAPVSTRPIVFGGSVAVVTTGGDVVRLDARGKETGRVSLGSPVHGGCVARGSMLYVNADADGGQMMAFDLERNVVRWTLRGLGTLMAPPAVSGSALVVANADREGTVLVLEP